MHLHVLSGAHTLSVFGAWRGTDRASFWVPATVTYKALPDQYHLSKIWRHINDWRQMDEQSFLVLMAQRIFLSPVTSTLHHPPWIKENFAIVSVLVFLHDFLPNLRMWRANKVAYSVLEIV